MNFKLVCTKQRTEAFLHDAWKAQHSELKQVKKTRGPFSADQSSLSVKVPSPVKSILEILQVTELSFFKTIPRGQEKSEVHTHVSPAHSVPVSVILGRIEVPRRRRRTGKAISCAVSFGHLRLDRKRRVVFQATNLRVFCSTVQKCCFQFLNNFKNSNARFSDFPPFRQISARVSTKKNRCC